MNSRISAASKCSAYSISMHSKGCSSCGMVCGRCRNKQVGLQAQQSMQQLQHMLQLP